MLDQVLGGEEPITHRPADDLAPELDEAKAQVGDLARDLDDVLSYVMFPQPAKEFLQWRSEGGGPERELVAAVVGAMVIGERAASAAPAEMQQVILANGEAASWKSFGRMRQMR